jgi:hypothetical protein
MRHQRNHRIYFVSSFTISMVPVEEEEEKHHHEEGLLPITVADNFAYNIFSASQVFSNGRGTFSLFLFVVP